MGAAGYDKDFACDVVVAEALAADVFAWLWLVAVGWVFAWLGVSWFCEDGW